MNDPEFPIREANAGSRSAFGIQDLKFSLDPGWIIGGDGKLNHEVEYQTALFDV
jgi:hypothetical protein